MNTDGARKRDSLRKRTVAGCLLLVLALALPSGAQVEFNWTNTAGGVFSEGDNWTTLWFGNAPLTDEDIARWNTGDHPRYTVTFDGGVTNHAAVIGVDAAGHLTDVVWDLGGHTYALTNGLTVGQGADASVMLTITNGQFRSGDDLIGLAGGGAATVHLQGPNTTWHRITGDTEIGLNTNISRLLITDGAKAYFNRTHVGHHHNRNGYLEISGEGSYLHSDHNCTIGSLSGHAEILVADGGEWDVRLGINLGATTGSSILRIDNGTVSARNFIMERGAMLDITLHTGGTNALMTGRGSYDLPITAPDPGNNNLELSLAPGFESEIDEVFTLISIVEGRIIDGVFRYQDEDILEGSLITIDGFAHPFQASYKDSRFTLTVIPEPGVLGLLALAGTGLLLCRRRVRRVS